MPRPGKAGAVKWKIAGVVVVLTAAIGIAIFFLRFGQKKEAQPTRSSAMTTVQTSEADDDPVRQRAYWNEVIEKDGLTKAAAEFKQAYMTASFSKQHEAAHVWGRLVYEHVGLKGVSVCDSSFAFGCYHSLFGTAIAQEGTGVVKDFDKACIEAYGEFGTGCQHGIGHGIMEYYGSSGLADALVACGETTQKNPLFGCTSGVFMEYNSPTTISDSGARTGQRTYSSASPTAPCNALTSPMFALSCYYELSQWLVTSMNTPEVAAVCAGIKDAKFSTVCFNGLGTAIASRSSYEVASATASCGSMPASGKAACAAGAAWALYAEPSARSRAGQVCASLGQAAGACTKEAKLICTYLPTADEQEACAKNIVITL